ncbi:peptidyl-prolyl cis-trans isomerase, partial [Myxococcota bacterium]|nr:peptidyl-prolyl cis-trans isomerase [Myxococcota bacterium]
MKHLRFILVASIALGVAACNQKTTPTEEYVAKVNSQGITKAVYDQAVERNMARYRGGGHELPAGIEQRIQESVLRRLIDDEIIEQKAKAAGVVVSAEDLAKKFEEYRKRFRSEEAFKSYLERSKSDEISMKEDLRRNELRDRLVKKLSGEAEIKEEEIKEYYEQNKARFVQKAQVKTSRILMRIAPNATDKEKAAIRKEAKKLRKKAMAKDADFAVIAKEFSKAPEAGRGGDLGWRTRGQFPGGIEIENAAFELGENKVSDVIETKAGLEIVKVWSKREARELPFDEVKESIKNSLTARKRNEKRREVLRTLKSEAKVEKLIKFEKAAAGPKGKGMPGMGRGPKGPGKP